MEAATNAVPAVDHIRHVIDEKETCGITAASLTNAWATLCTEQNQSSPTIL